jgi:phosphopantothenoylcysteine decarboxylase/phosphopantothenate--cysteine ligase
MNAMLKDKEIVLGVTGGIAAYKAAEFIRLLSKEGAKVHVVMPRSSLPPSLFKRSPATRS